LAVSNAAARAVQGTWVMLRYTETREESKKQGEREQKYRVTIRLEQGDTNSHPSERTVIVSLEKEKTLPDSEVGERGVFQSER